MITYKVVDKNTRYGSNYACLGAGGFTEKEFKNFLEEMPELKPYFPKYKKGNIVKMVPNSVGLMSFINKQTAQEFLDVNILYKNGIIIKCKAKGNSTQFKPILAGCGDDPRILVNKATLYHFRVSLEGTVFSEELEVLE